MYLDSISESLELISREFYGGSALRNEGHDGNSSVASNDWARNIGLNLDEIGL
jgi:hypothetical protein